MGLANLFKSLSRQPEMVIIDPARENPHNAAKKLIEDMQKQLPDHDVLSQSAREIAMARLVV